MQDVFSCIFGIIALVSQAIEIKHVKQKMLMYKSSMKHACKRACPSLASRASVESDSESVGLDKYEAWFFFCLRIIFFNLKSISFHV